MLYLSGTTAQPAVVLEIVLFVRFYFVRNVPGFLCVLDGSDGYKLPLVKCLLWGFF